MLRAGWKKSNCNIDNYLFPEKHNKEYIGKLENFHKNLRKFSIKLLEKLVENLYNFVEKYIWELQNLTIFFFFSKLRNHDSLGRATGSDQFFLFF